MPEPFTIAELVAAGSPSAVALAAPAARPLSYEALRHQVDRIVATLNRSGVGRNDRVALVLPNGPEMAVAFLGTTAGATAAPLNPAYRGEEFAFYMSDLGARALIVEEGSESAAVAEAARLGIRVLRIRPTPEAGAGALELAADPGAEANDAAASDGGFAAAD